VYISSKLLSSGSNNKAMGLPCTLLVDAEEIGKQAAAHPPRLQSHRDHHSTLTRTHDGVGNATALQLLLGTLLPKQDAPEQVEWVEYIISTDARHKHNTFNTSAAGGRQHIAGALICGGGVPRQHTNDS
jgi:hypothetical protein